MSTVRDSLQAARITRTKARVHAWWHANHCASCAARRNGEHPLAQLLRGAGLEVQAVGESDGTPPVTGHGGPQRH